MDIFFRLYKNFDIDLISLSEAGYDLFRMHSPLMKKTIMRNRYIMRPADAPDSFIRRLVLL